MSNCPKIRYLKLILTSGLQLRAEFWDWFISNQTSYLPLQQYGDFICLKTSSFV
jgi:hypothetical protein